jgi:hypothetical protein
MFKPALIFILLFASLASHARDGSVAVLKTDAYTHLEAGAMQNGKLYYNDAIVDFSEWAKTAPVENKFLLLYPGYKEPLVTVLRNGVEHPYVEKLTMFVARTKAAIDKAPSQLNLKSFLNIETIRKFLSEMRHQPITSDQVISRVLERHQPVRNFQWCNDQGAVINRPALETNLSYINPPHGAWCSDSGRSLCLESCYAFNKFWQTGVRTFNAMDPQHKKDLGIAFQSEVRYFTSESDMGAPVPVSQLTGLDTPMTGALEINIFFFNQLMEYGKVLAIFQAHPSDPHKTIVSSYLVMGLKSRTYNKHELVKEVILGQTYFNTGSGITAGLPVFTQNIAKSILQTLN